MKKSKQALFGKAVKKALIRRMGRVAGCKEFKHKRGSYFGLVDWYLYSDQTAKALAAFWAKRYVEETARMKAILYRLQNNRPLLVGRSGGELDPTDGIYRELRTKLDEQYKIQRSDHWPIWPDALIAY